MNLRRTLQRWQHDGPAFKSPCIRTVYPLCHYDLSALWQTFASPLSAQYGGNNSVPMPRQVENLVGHEYGRLTVTRVFRQNGKTLCECECSCGMGKFLYEDGRPVSEKTRVTVFASNLKSEATTSCGCLRTEKDESAQIKDALRRNRKFGHLFVMGYVKSRGRYIAACSCGLHPAAKLVSVPGAALIKNRRIGCDLFHRKQAQLRKAHPRAFSSYAAMIRRTSDPRNKRYGGRGIRVCAEWLPYSPGCGFSRFLKDMGPRPANMSLHRDEKKGQHYTPATCVWANDLRQSTERAVVRVVVYRGEEMSVTRFCRMINMPRRLVRKWLSWGKTAEYIAAVVEAQRRGESTLHLHRVHPWRGTETPAPAVAA